MPADAARAPGPGEQQPPEHDDTLTLLFLCCHPALSAASQLALTLRAVGGLTTAEIAQAFLVPEATMAQRISRAKQRIRAAGAAFGMPPREELAERLRVVLHVLYLVFNEGYTASSGDELIRELCAEAIRLTRVLRELMPEEPEVEGLLALMLLTESRRPGRTTPDGDLVLLADQDRSRWDGALIAEGQAIVRECLRRNRPGPYQVQAAINAVHSDARSAANTDWRQVVRLYDQLLALSPTPVVALKGGRGGRGRRCRCGAGACRRPRPGPLPPLPCDPGGPVEPARPRCRRGAGLRRGERRRHQFRRAALLERARRALLA